MIDGFVRMFDFQGRSSRPAYWWWTLFAWVFLITGYLLSMEFGPVLLIFFYLALLLPSIAVTVRRLHDVGQSGAWLGWTVVFAVLNALLWIIFAKDLGDAFNSGDFSYLQGTARWLWPPIAITGSASFGTSLVIFFLTLLKSAPPNQWGSGSPNE